MLNSQKFSRFRKNFQEHYIEVASSFTKFKGFSFSHRSKFFTFISFPFVVEFISASRNFRGTLIYQYGDTRCRPLCPFLITVPFCHRSSDPRSSYLRYIRGIISLDSFVRPLPRVSLSKNSSKGPLHVTAGVSP